MATSAERQTGDEYAVRWYEPGDREGIRSLYEVEGAPPERRMVRLDVRRRSSP